MDGEVERLKQQLEDLAGRVVADHAILRQALLVSSTPHLRATHVTIEKLAEDPSVQANFRAMPYASRKAFEDRRKGWLQVVEQEIASRQAVNPAG